MEGRYWQFFHELFKLFLFLIGLPNLHFLQHNLAELLVEVLLQLKRDMWFMQEGAPSYFCQAVRVYLDAVFPKRWIRYGSVITWPLRSPDFNPLGFFYGKGYKSHKSELSEANPMFCLDCLKYEKR